MSARRFARFACIDWSGARGERHRGIAVAECGAGTAAPTLVTAPDARPWSRAGVLAWLVAQSEAGADLIVGIDLSTALPFVDADAYFPGDTASPTGARALWALIDTVCAADPHLGIDTFVDHPLYAPFFRRHGAREGARFGGGRGRLRLTEQRTGGASSCFNLVGAAQVGRASLTGMRLLHRLGGRMSVWPFDPVPASGPLLVEIYTRIAAVAAGRPPGRTKIRDAAALAAALTHLGSDVPAALDTYDDHRTDAIMGAAWLRTVAADPALWHPTGLDAVRHTEGWTFGVT